MSRDLRCVTRLRKGKGPRPTCRRRARWRMHRCRADACCRRQPSSFSTAAAGDSTRRGPRSRFPTRTTPALFGSCGTTGKGQAARSTESPLPGKIRPPVPTQRVARQEFERQESCPHPHPACSNSFQPMLSRLKQISTLSLNRATARAQHFSIAIVPRRRRANDCHTVVHRSKSRQRHACSAIVGSTTGAAAPETIDRSAMRSTPAKGNR